MASYILLGPNLEIDLKKTQKSFLSSNINLTIYGDTKNRIDCTKLNLPSYSQIIIHAHVSTHNTIDLCKDTFNTKAALNLIANYNPQNFELFSCYSGVAINQRLTLSNFTTLITSASEHNAVLTRFNQYIISALNNINNTNQFIKFADYIYLIPDVLKFAIQTNKEMLSYQTNFDRLVNFSDNKINEWRETQLIDFKNWVINIKNDIDNSIRLEEINEFIEVFSEHKEPAEQLSKKYSLKSYKSFLLFSAAANNKLKLIDNLVASDIELINLQFNEIDAKANLDFQTNKGPTALYVAAQEGHAEVVQKLIDAKANLDLPNKNGATALYIAALEGHAEVVQKLIDAKANLDLPNKNGVTALFIAAKNGHAEVVQKLIDAKVDLNIKFITLLTVLDVAALDDHLNVVKAILASGYNNISGLILTLLISKAIQKEINKFYSNPIKYILEANNLAKHAENALSIFLERTKDNFASKVFYSLESYLPNAFSYLEPSKNLINEIHETKNCLAAQNHTIELDLYSLCGENSSWYQTIET